MRLDPSVRPLDEAATLPRTAAVRAAALNRVSNLRAAPIELAWPGGPLSCHWSASSLHGAAIPYDIYRFALGPYTGCVGLDAASQAFLFDEPLHAPLPSDLRHVLLAHATHAWAEALSHALRMHFQWDAGGLADPRRLLAQAPADAVFFRILDQDRLVVQGFFALEQDDAYTALSRAPWDAPGIRAAFHDMEDLRFPVVFELGSTTIRIDEVRNIRRGDIVSIERWQSVGRGIAVQCMVPGRDAPRWSAIAEGSRIKVQAMRDTNMTTARGAEVDEPAGAESLPIDRLDALEVTLRFEVGALDVSLGELKAIGVGHVFDLAQPLNRCAVRVLAHGNVLGKGHLVAVGDRLGVRITEFAPKPTG